MLSGRQSSSLIGKWFGGALLFTSLTVCTSALTPAVPETGRPPSANDYSHKVLPEVAGVVTWRTLAKVERVRQGVALVPRFSLEILQLNEKIVKVQGFIMPLEAAGMQKHFLLSAVPPSCAFCLPGGPESLVEVIGEEFVRPLIEPIVMSGRFVVLKDDPGGVLYRLLDARFERLAVP